MPIDRVIESGYTLCWAALWYGTNDVMFDSIYDSTPKQMLARIHKLLDECDAVITYNGASFDLPTLNKEFLVHGFNPPAPYKQIDLYRIVKSTFRFASKKLDFVLKELGLEGKKKHRGMDLWKGCMSKDAECWAEMKAYNCQDVLGLVPAYERIRPWIRVHPNAGLYDEPGLPVCPNCGGGHLQRRGYAHTPLNKYARYQCQGCGKWSRESLSELPKEDRANIMRPVN